MIKASLLELFERDLEKLKNEISLYKEENNIWVIKGEVINSAGNLCLHLIGNLNHFIGASLGNSGYIRQRDLEFSSKNIPRAELIAEVEKTSLVVSSVLNKMDDDLLRKKFPIELLGKSVTTEFLLIHLLTHLNYHLGQINYHRRLIDN